MTLCSSGLLLHTRGVTAKRERESEREGSAEKEANFPLNKMQRQSTEVSFLLLLLFLLFLVHFLILLVLVQLLYSPPPTTPADSLPLL